MAQLLGLTARIDWLPIPPKKDCLSRFGFRGADFLHPEILFLLHHDEIKP